MSFTPPQLMTPMPGVVRAVHSSPGPWKNVRFDVTLYLPNGTLFDYDGIQSARFGPEDNVDVEGAPPSTPFWGWRIGDDVFPDIPYRYLTGDCAAALEASSRIPQPAPIRLPPTAAPAPGAAV